MPLSKHCVLNIILSRIIKGKPFFQVDFKLGGGNSKIFYFHPEIWGRWTHFDSYFSKGLVQPPTSKPLRIFAPAKKTLPRLSPSSPTRQSLGPLAVSALRQRESAREAGRTWGSRSFHLGVQLGERGLFHKRNLLRG